MYRLSSSPGRRLLFFLLCGKPTKPHTKVSQKVCPPPSDQACRFALLTPKITLPQTDPGPSGLGLRILPASRSIAWYPPFRARPSGRAPYNNFSKHGSFFTAQSLPLARLVQDDGSRKLPQNSRSIVVLHPLYSRSIVVLHPT